MIEATDLRIGNWVKIRGQYYVQVVTILTEWISYNDTNGCNYKDISPIPLTPEILEQCGFEKEQRGKLGDFDGIETVFYFQGVDIFDHTEHGQGFDYATYTRYPGRGFKAGRTISYVHELQNLIHSLTGEELNIQL